LLAKAEGGSGIAQYNLGLIYANNRNRSPISSRPMSGSILLPIDGATGKALVLVSIR